MDGGDNLILLKGAIDSVGPDPTNSIPTPAYAGNEGDA
jgi:hypothetical protein